jgi:subtilisin family serine protease
MLKRRGIYSLSLALLLLFIMSWQPQRGQSNDSPGQIELSVGSARIQSQAEQPKSKFRKKQGDNAIANQYIVVFKDDIPGLEIASRAADLAFGHGGTINHVYQHALKGFSIRLSEEAAIALSQDPRIDYVEEDGKVSISATQFGAPWGLDRIDQRNLPLSSTYTYTNTGAGVNAYVIDGGIRITHQQFGGRAFKGTDTIDDDNNPSTPAANDHPFGLDGIDCSGHGTHVAGTIGGTTYGVAKNVRLHSVRVFPCNGLGASSNIIAGIDWVAANHIKPAVANMSFGGPPDTATDNAVRNLIARGVTCVVAAGNANSDAGNVSPAHVTEALTISATDASDFRAVFNVFTGSAANYGSVVDLFAPGHDITSAWWLSDTATNTISGTSMAAPHVAGVAALYLQTHQFATPNEVGGVIKHTATKNVVNDPGPGSPNRLLFLNFPMSAAIVPLYRYWNPSVTDHYYTINYNELGEGGLGWSIEKIAGFVSSQQQFGTVPLYRYWSPSWGDHFYTTNFNELGNGAQGWVFEKVECYVYSQQQSGTVPLYRYWNSSIGNHYYTTNFSELGNGANGYVFEWVQGYVLPLN